MAKKSIPKTEYDYRAGYYAGRQMAKKGHPYVPDLAKRPGYKDGYMSHVFELRAAEEHAARMQNVVSRREQKWKHS